MQRVGSIVHLGSFPDSSGEELKVAFIHDPPFVFIHEESADNFTHSGYLVDLWQTITQGLNLTYRFLPPTTDGFGALLKNGTWTGMVGEVAQERADVALSWLFYRSDRAEVLDYLDKVPVFSGGYEFYVRRGERDTLHLSADMFNSLLRPLDTNVWLILLLSLLVLTVGLTVTIYLNRRRGETELTCRQFSFGSSLLSVYLTVTGQGWALVPDSCSARIITISSWMMGILISMNYTANLISYLTLSQPDAPISSLEEFTSSADWTLAMENGVGSLGDWAVSSDPSENHLYNRVLERDRFLPLDGTKDTMLRAAAPKTLLFYNIDMMFTSIKEEACNLLPLLQPNPNRRPEPSYMVVRKGLGSLKRQINHMLQRLMQAGTLDRLKRRWFGNGGHICADGAMFRPLSLADLLAVLVIVPLAVISSGLLLTAELLARWLRGRVNSSGALLYAAPSRSQTGRQRGWSGSVPNSVNIKGEKCYPLR